MRMRDPRFRPEAHISRKFATVKQIDATLFASCGVYIGEQFPALAFLALEAELGWPRRRHIPALGVNFDGLGRPVGVCTLGVVQHSLDYRDASLTFLHELLGTVVLRSGEPEVSATLGDDRSDHSCVSLQ